jgi:hypothetical protein
MDIIIFIKVGRLKWAGHVFRMDQQRKEFLTPKQKAEEKEGGLNYDGKMEWTIMLKLWGKETG